MEEITRPSVLEIDVDAFKYNIVRIRQKVGQDVKIMPVIKADAYGTQINKLTSLMNKFDIVAVAIVDEAIALRKQGFDKEIFVLNQPYKDEIDKIVDYNITCGISSDSFLEELGRREEEVTVHIEIGTGMGRTGINPARVKEYIGNVKKYENIKIEGIYTHLSSADIDEEYTKKQLNSFKNAVEDAKELVGDLKYIHASASNGILFFPDSYYNLVRPGIIMYGYESCDRTNEIIDIRPVAKLKSKITFLKEVKAGTSIGYSRSYITDRDTKVATIPIGYADGLKRALSNNGNVVIKDVLCPIIGNICMDSFMVDVSHLKDVSVGDDVYIWDNDNITLEEVAKKCNTINYEILSTISPRIPRVFVSED